MYVTAGINAIFNEILSRHVQIVDRICATYATAYAPADDMRQEVLASIWRGLHHFRGEAALSTWVYRIAINTCISYLRLNARHGNTTDLANAPDVPADSADSADNREMTDYLLSLLSPMEKAMMLMRMDGKSYAEIAEVTGLAPGVVGTRLTRAKQKLQKIISDKGGNI